MKLKYILIIILIAFTICGTGLDVGRMLLINPYPKKVTAEYDTEDCVFFKKDVALKISGNYCDEKCQNYIKYSFNHTIVTTLKSMIGLQNFRISVHKTFDLKTFTPRNAGNVNTISVIVKQNPYPKLEIGINESYKMEITNEKIEIQAENVYGVNHAFESIVQLFKIVEGTEDFYIQFIPISIEDEPLYKWRGLLVDPSRNYLPPKIFYKIVDTLAFMKCNILHIHLTDAQQFVFESKKFPDLSKKGTYSSKMVLTQEFLKDLKQYAHQRGVMIVGEIEMPGHAGSWGFGYPNVVANSMDYFRELNFGENNFALNPADPLTFEIIESLVSEVGESFNSDYVHVGGSEVVYSAWSKSKQYNEIKKWMRENDIEDLSQLESYFNQYAQQSVKNTGKIPIVWQEVFEKGNIVDGSVVHIWYDGKSETVKKIIDSGHKVIISDGLFLDKQSPRCHRDTGNDCGTNYMYVWSNRDMSYFNFYSGLNTEQIKNVLGGEGCTWGESVDMENLFSRTFQRFATVAEKFWSKGGGINSDNHEVRADNARCFGMKRGFMYGTGPLYHNFCDTFAKPDARKF